MQSHCIRSMICFLFPQQQNSPTNQLLDFRFYGLLLAHKIINHYGKGNSVGAVGEIIASKAEDVFHGSAFAVELIGVLWKAVFERS